jgi:hypothetical protein
VVAVVVEDITEMVALVVEDITEVVAVGSEESRVGVEGGLWGRSRGAAEEEERITEVLGVVL